MTLNRFNWALLVSLSLHVAVLVTVQVGARVADARRLSQQRVVAAHVSGSSGWAR